MNSKLILIIAIVIAAGAFIVFGGKKENSAPKTASDITVMPTTTAPKEEVVTVALTDTGFTPKEVTVKKGTKVVWSNSSGKTATVDSADHPAHLLHPFLNLGNFADGATLEVVFDNPGKYNYHNHYNSSEAGIITVE